MTGTSPVMTERRCLTRETEQRTRDGLHQRWAVVRKGRGCDDWSIRRCRCRVDGQTHHYSGAFAERGADTHRAAVHFGERLGDSEAKARTLILFGELALHLLEGTAELMQIAFRNADAVVFDGDNDGVGPYPAMHLHGAALGCELDRIGQKIERDLLERAPIRLQMDRRVDLRNELEVFLVGALRDHAQAVGEN